MSVEENQVTGRETPGYSRLGRGHVSKGRWYCECDRPARCITTKKNSPNRGRRFWKCAKVYDLQCAFFLWLDHEAAAKDWLITSHLPPTTQTPTKSGDNGDDLDSMPQILETPFTKGKRKEVSQDIIQHNNNADHRVSNPNASEEDRRKAARISMISAPGQHFIERLQSSPRPLPTPNSRDNTDSSNTMASHLWLPQQRDASPTPGQCNDVPSLNPPADSDLTATIVELIRAEHPQLKASTEVQLRHEVGLTLDVGEAKLRRHEVTISELQKRIDGLEMTVSLLR